MNVARKSLVALCLTMTYIMTPAMAEIKKTTLRIVETSDVHGCFFPYDFIERKPMRGTLARVCSYVNRLRRQYGDNVILLENGDILQGQPTCYYYNYINTAATNIAADVANYMRYDAQTFGNHDMETGHAVYDKWIKELDCPVIASNVIDTRTNRPYTTPYTILNRGGVRIAVLGMLTPAIPNWLNESLWENLRFESIKKAAIHWIDYLKKNEHPDLIVGLFHSGWDGGISTPLYREDETETAARDVPGFDIIFFGHDHRQRKAVVRNSEGADVLCLDPSCNALMVAEASVDIEIDEAGKVTVKRIDGDIMDICREKPDEEFMRRFEAAIEQVNGYVERRIGTLANTIYTRDCFFGSAPFTDLIHNIQLNITGADVSFNAPLSFDISMAKGDIHVSDLFKLYKYENQICVLNMTGDEIRRHLEMSYDLWVNTMKSPDDHIMLLDEDNKSDMQKYGFRNMTFNFDSAAGIEYEVDVTKPDGQKVRILQTNDGKPFDLRKWYKVVMNSYRGNGGGELLTRGAGIPKDSLSGRFLYQTDKDLRYYIMNEIEKTGSICPKANGNWRFVPEAWTRPAIERDRQLLFGK